MLLTDSNMIFKAGHQTYLMEVTAGQWCHRPLKYGGLGRLCLPSPYTNSGIWQVHQQPAISPGMLFLNPWSFNAGRSTSRWHSTLSGSREKVMAAFLLGPPLGGHELEMREALTSSVWPPPPFEKCSLELGSCTGAKVQSPAFRAHPALSTDPLDWNHGD
ncbi:hypothetical protein B0H34DRAFT_3570 [Crassisporium funariophilum]|nr:hypothetical protein B0H34DRAFT_3570 [Crassisporium funariophilum]